MTKAIAEPGTPQPNCMINTRARTTFRTDDKMRKYKGVRLSPKARQIQARRLYIIMATMPYVMMMI